MECSLAFFDGGKEPLSEGINAGIIRQLEIVHASHYARQVVVRGVRGLTRLADHCEHRRQAFETYHRQSR